MEDTNGAKKIGWTEEDLKEVGPGKILGGGGRGCLDPALSSRLRGVRHFPKHLPPALGRAQTADTGTGAAGSQGRNPPGADERCWRRVGERLGPLSTVRLGAVSPSFDHVAIPVRDAVCGPHRLHTNPHPCVSQWSASGARRLAGWLAGRLAGWLAGWLAGFVSEREASARACCSSLPPHPL
ncbi:hypothetical protein T484DRAFT_3367124 [Baffinella frigidus]|nr:hypothetical protein T484DRAFT_3367124 [Cryptophyta sp. CCMP2293]